MSRFRAMSSTLVWVTAFWAMREVGLVRKLCWKAAMCSYDRADAGAVSAVGVHNYSIAALHDLHGTSEAIANAALTSNLLFAAMLAMRLYSPNSIGLGITKRAPACSLAIAANALAKSSGLTAGTS